MGLQSKLKQTPRVSSQSALIRRSDINWSLASALISNAIFSITQLDSRAQTSTIMGPTYCMYLISKPLLPDPSPCMNIYCESGGFNGKFGIFFSCSRYFQELLVKPCNCSPCSTCEPSIYLPDFSTSTVAHLAQLLESGETEVETEVEIKRVRQLQAGLRCSGVSRAKKLRPKLTPGQCAACLRYVQYIT